MHVIETPTDEIHTKMVLLVTTEQTSAEPYVEWLASKYPTRFADDGRDALDAIGDDTGVVVLACNLQNRGPKEFLDQARAVGYDGKVALIAESRPNIDFSESDFDSFLSKPVSESTLIATVDKLMNQVRYEHRLDQYMSLSMKRARWETHEPTEKLKASERYADLIEELTELRTELNEIVSNFETDDFNALFREESS